MGVRRCYRSRLERLLECERRNSDAGLGVLRMVVSVTAGRAAEDTKEVRGPCRGRRLSMKWIIIHKLKILGAIAPATALIRP